MSHPLSFLVDNAIRAAEAFVHAGYPTDAAAILLCELDGTESEVDPRSSATAEVREALLGLGYGSDEVIAVLREVPGEQDAAEMLKDALQGLATW